MPEPGRLPSRETDRLRGLPLTYPAGDGVPQGFRAFSRGAVIGNGRADFLTASEAALTWQVQLRSGVGVAASAARVDGDEPVVTRLSIPVGPLRFTGFCRVVAVIDERSRRGFADGTLPGHPESGEESFVVEQDEHDDVRLVVTAFSTPASLLARLGGPFTRRAQDRMTDRYLRALGPGSH